jgi:hypothetical protein
MSVRGSGAAPVHRHRRSVGPATVIRFAVLSLLVAAGAWTVGRTLTVHDWPDRVHPAPDLEHPRPSQLTGPAIRRLQREGVVVRPQVRRMLDVLLGYWEARPDLRLRMTNADGTPNVFELLKWAQSSPDSSATAMVPHLGALEELRGRMGSLPLNGKVLPVIYWEMQNRKHPSQDTTKLVGRLAEFWESRPDVRTLFTRDGRVDLVGLLRFVNRLPKTDSAYQRFIDDTIPIHQVISELERNRNG